MHEGHFFKEIPPDQISREKKDEGQWLEYPGLVGFGAFSNVYRGQYTPTPGTVLKIVLKFDKKQLYGHITDDEKEATKQRILKEANIHAQFNHENIIRFYGISENALNFRGLTLILERAISTLLEWVHLPREKLNDFAKAQIAYQVASGLAHIHEHNIVHHDLNLNNIFMCRSGVVKIGDFGISGHPDPLPSPSSPLPSGLQQAPSSPLSVSSSEARTSASPPSSPLPPVLRQAPSPRVRGISGDLYDYGLVFLEIFRLPAFRPLEGLEQIESESMREKIRGAFDMEVTKGNASYIFEIAVLLEKQYVNIKIQRKIIEIKRM